jgi:hypothetical protein
MPAILPSHDVRKPYQGMNEKNHTTFLLQMNAPQRIKERRLLIELGSYPCQKD